MFLNAFIKIIIQKLCKTYLKFILNLYLGHSVKMTFLDNKIELLDINRLNKLINYSLREKVSSKSLFYNSKEGSEKFLII